MLQQGTGKSATGGQGGIAPKQSATDSEGLTLEQRVVEDPLLSFVANYWKQVIVVLGAVVIIFWVKNVFETTHTQAMRSSADAYGAVRDEFAALLTLQADLISAKQRAAQEADVKEDKVVPKTEVEKLEQQFKESKEKLGKSVEALAFAKSPYNDISKLYAGLSASLDRDIAGVRSGLGSLVLSDKSSPKDSTDLIRELATVVLARVLVDDEKSYAEGRSLLKLLTKNNDGIAVSAAVSFARISSSEAEKKEAISVLTDLQNRAPEQNAIIEKELQTLSAS